MNNLQLTNILLGFDKSMAKNFCGVIPIDAFVRMASEWLDLSTPNTFIVNATRIHGNANWRRETGHWLFVQIGPPTHVAGKSSGDGQEWGARGGIKVLYFDSYARDIDFYGRDFSDLLRGIATDSIEPAPFKVQSSKSRLCGLFCVLVAFNINSFDHNLTALVKHFFKRSADELELEKNDDILLEWVLKQSFSMLFKKVCATSTEDHCISFNDLF